MGYRIGEIADLFGMSKEGVRFLERQGILVSLRDENNGYRYFTRSEITKLKQIRTYQALGFSLEEAMRMVCQVRREELLPCIEEKLAELYEKEKQLNRMKEMLLEQQQIARSLLNETDCSVVMRPEMIILPAARDEASSATCEEKKQIAALRRAEKSWIQAMPPVTLGAVHYDVEGNKISGKYGCAAPASLVSKLGLPVLPCMIRLPSCLCVRCVQETTVKRMVDIEPMIDWARAHGYEPYGEVYSNVKMSYFSEDGEIYRIREVFVPIRE